MLNSLLDHKLLRIVKYMCFMMKIVQIRPALNGRFLCHLVSGEDVIVSRKYVPDLKARIRGDRS